MKKLKLLIWKNFKILSREKFSTLAEILLPMACLLVFASFRHIIKDIKHPGPSIYESFSINEPPDFVLDQAETLYYTPSNPITDKIMEKVRKDFFQFESFNYSVKGFASENQLADAYYKRRDEDPDVLSRGPVLAGIVFEKIGNTEITSDIEYKLRFPGYQRTDYEGFTDRTNFRAAWFTENIYPIVRFSGPRSKDNKYGGFPGYFEEGFLYLQYALDRSIGTMLLNASQIKELNYYELKMQRFPHIPFAHDKYLVVTLAWIPYFFGISYIYLITNLTRLIIQEKATRLKEFMKIMGLKNWQHWISWFIRSFTVVTIVTTLVTCIFKIEIGGHSVYKHSDPFLIFLCLFTYGLNAITYAFLFSTLFSNVDAGSAVAGFTWVVSIFPFFGYFPRFCQMSRAEKLFRGALMPNTSMCFLFYILGLHESDNLGLQWETLWTGSSPNDQYSVGDSLGMMLLNSLVYLIGALYLELAFPGPYGVKLPWYYPFTVWFWTGRPRDPTILPLRPAEIRHDAFENVSEDLKAGIEFQNFSKIFGSKVAVNNLNFKIYKNQVTSLVGHNGAGKTTTMSILTGLLRPSSGTAFVNGFDICTDMPHVRASLGLCPQYNVLFDDLTVEEHLKFFCQLKGLGSDETREEIERCLKVLGLEGKRHTESKNLSGGMKRKLCVGIAFSAGSNVILLDEPTAGMDPGARRSTWELIQHEKAGKTVILSTHYMEEADLLGDRIAIMKGGQIQCCGSSLFLKSKYGGAYKLMIVKKEPCSIEGIKSVITKSIPTVEFKDLGAELSCTLPPEHINKFPAIFQELEDRKDELGIGTYGVGSTSMEEIFVRVGESTDEDIPKSDPDSSSFKISAEPLSAQFTEPVKDSIGRGGLFAKYNFSPQNVKSRNEGTALLRQQLKAMLVKRCLVSLRQWKVAILQILIPAAINLIILYEARNVPVFDDPISLTVSYKDYEVFKPSTVLFNCPAESTLCDSFKDFHVYDRNVADIEEAPMVSFILQEMEKSVREVHTNYILGFEQTSLRKKHDRRQMTVFFNNQPHHTPTLALNAYTNGLFYHLGENIRITVKNHPFKLHFKDRAFCDETYSPEFFVGFSSLISGSFLSAAFVILPVVEQLSKSKRLQEICGIRLPLYWFAEFVANFVTSLVCIVLLLLTTIWMGAEEYQSFSMQARFVFLFLAYVLAVIPTIMLISKFCKSPSSGYARILSGNLNFGAISCIVVSLFSTPEFKTQDKARMAHDISMMHPNYALGTALAAIGGHRQLRQACGGFPLDFICLMNPDMKCCKYLQASYFSWEKFGVGSQTFMLLTFSFIFVLLLTISESGIVGKILLKHEKRKNPNTIDSIYITNDSNGVGDPDVASENSRIVETPLAIINQTDILVLKNLTKTFKGNLTAVDHLNLGVKKGEIFGLLGINGAGKTTTLEMLTGTLNITSGDAYINSYSVKKNPRKAHSYLGYCPQFDACIEELTGRETLTLFGRIKGMPEDEIKISIGKLSGNLLFTEFLDKAFSTYSGGNKRKLSTALAMLGDPEIIFLDEPTAGMDPVARRHVWNAISMLRDTGTSIVITSHNMEECEALCSRVAIMVKGKFKCLGSLQSLKSKLSPGYKLVAQIPYENSNGPKDWRTRFKDFDEFLLEAFPGCTLKDSHPGFVQYNLPTTVAWSRIFTTMEEAKIKFQLEAYSVGQVDLEQVFFNFAQE